MGDWSIQFVSRHLAPNEVDEYLASYSFQSLSVLRGRGDDARVINAEFPWCQRACEGNPNSYVRLGTRAVSSPLGSGRRQLLWIDWYRHHEGEDNEVDACRRRESAILLPSEIPSGTRVSEILYGDVDGDYMMDLLVRLTNGAAILLIPSEGSRMCRGPDIIE